MCHIDSGALHHIENIAEEPAEVIIAASTACASRTGIPAPPKWAIYSPVRRA